MSSKSTSSQQTIITDGTITPSGSHKSIKSNKGSKGAKADPLKCHYCKLKFASEAEVKAHTHNSCDRKVYSLNRGHCPMCQSRHAQFDDFVKHLEICGRSTVPIKVAASQLPPKSESVAKPQRVSPSKSSRNILSRTFGLTMNSKKACLFFAGVNKCDSLIGGCAWLLTSDSKHSVLAKDSTSIHQNFVSQIRPEYEALYHGLNSAIQQKIYVLTIKGCSEIIQSQFSDNVEIPFLTSVYKEVEDLSLSISKCLSQFESVTFEVISPEENHFCYHMAEEAIKTYHENQQKVLVKTMDHIPSPPPISHLPTRRVLPTRSTSSRGFLSNSKTAVSLHDISNWFKVPGKMNLSSKRQNSPTSLSRFLGTSFERPVCV